MPRILIVDDEIGIRSLLAAAFAEAGYDVLTAADGAEAMALCASSELFDVVLSDVIMPLVNGHDLIRWIMNREKRDQSTGRSHGGHPGFQELRL